MAPPTATASGIAPQPAPAATRTAAPTAAQTAAPAAPAHTRRALPRVLAGAFVALLVLAAAAALWVAVPAAIADYHAMGARHQLRQWQAGERPPPGLLQWVRAQDALQAALRHTPDDPHLHEGLGYLHALRAQGNANVLPSPSLQQGFLEQALAHYHRALQLRPMSGAAWAHVAMVQHRLDVLHTQYRTPAPAAGTVLGQAAPGLWPAFDRALQYGARELPVLLALTDIALTRWPQLAPERQNAYLAAVAQVPPRYFNSIDALAQQLGRADVLPPPTQAP